MSSEQGVTENRGHALSVPVARARSFATLVAELLIDSAGRRKRLVVWITLVAMMGALVRGGVIAFLSLYINWMDAGHTIDLGFATFEVGRNLPSLLVMIVVVVCSLVFAAWATYEAQARARLIARSALEAASARALELYSSSRSLGIPGQDKPRRQLHLNAVRNARHVSNATESIIHAIPPVLNASMAVSLALWLQPGPTVGVLALGLLAAPVLYKVSGSIAVRARSFYNETTFEMASHMRRRIDRIDLLPPLLLGETDYQRDLEDAPAVQNFLDTLDHNMLATDRMVLATGLLKAGFFAFAMAFFGWMHLSDSTSPGHMVAFFVAMLSMLNSMQQLSGILANLIRFQPQVSEYRAIRSLLESRSLSPDNVDHPGGRPVTLRLEDPAWPDGLASVPVAPGRPVMLLHPERVARSNLDTILAPLDALAPEPIASLWPTPDVFAPNDPARDPELLELLLDRAGDGYVARLRELGESEAAEVVSAASEQGGTHAAAAALAELAPGLPHAALAVAALASSPPRPLVLESEILRPLKPEDHPAVLEPLGDRVVLVAVHRPGGVAWGIGQAVVTDGDRALGMGNPEWLRARDLEWMRSGSNGTGLRDDSNDLDEG